jgi:hypothetical protein
MHQQGALHELGFKGGRGVLGEDGEIPQHFTDAAVAVAGLAFRAVDGLVDLQGAAGVAGADFDNAGDLGLGGVAGFVGGAVGGDEVDAKLVWVRLAAFRDVGGDLPGVFVFQVLVEVIDDAMNGGGTGEGFGPGRGRIGLGAAF